MYLFPPKTFHKTRQSPLCTLRTICNDENKKRKRQLDSSSHRRSEKVNFLVQLLKPKFIQHNLTLPKKTAPGPDFALLFKFENFFSVPCIEVMFSGKL